MMHGSCVDESNVQCVAISVQAFPF